MTTHYRSTDVRIPATIAEVDVRPMEDGYLVRVMGRCVWLPVRAASPTEAEAWEHAATDLRADAERELRGMSERADRIGQALEVE